MGIDIEKARAKRISCLGNYFPPVKSDDEGQQKKKNLSSIPKGYGTLPFFSFFVKGHHRDNGRDESPAKTCRSALTPLKSAAWMMENNQRQASCQWAR